MKVAICQLPDGLFHDSNAWTNFAKCIEIERPDMTVLNEIPFGPWVARSAIFNENLARASINAHEAALPALRALPGAVISSRPIECGNKLANEAFLVADGQYRAMHHKQYFPHEPGFFESVWFAAGQQGYDPIDYRGVRFGVLLCTEVVFNEWARHYRRQGVHVIVVPRASGTSLRFWHTAACMAAYVSGCYVVSSNRVSPRRNDDPCFGGGGFVYSPDGELLQETSETLPFVAVNINLDLVRRAQRSYPCYIPELADVPH